MSALPDGRQIWTRSFYGFSPEEDGYVGWTKASARDRYAARLNDGDLILIYGAVSVETAKAERSYVLGFVQVDTNPIHDHEKSSELGMARKLNAGHEGQWSEAIPIRRAWRAEEKVMIRRVAFNSYRPEAGQSLATHGTDLDADEIVQALKIKVREVSVFGEPPIAEADTKVQPFAEVFKPSRAFSKDNSALYCSFNTDLSPASFLESFAIWAHFVRIRSMTSTTNRADSAAPGVCKVLSLWVSPKSTTVFAPKNNGF